MVERSPGCGAAAPLLCRSAVVNPSKALRRSADYTCSSGSQTRIESPTGPAKPAFLITSPHPLVFALELPAVCSANLAFDWC